MNYYFDKIASLTPATKRVLCEKATEAPGTMSNNPVTHGTYLCRRCGIALFRGESQFNSGCGWPSFDAEVSRAVKRELDADGRRTEILCSRCDGHLGHVFRGELFTAKNIRHCVNSASLDFVEDNEVLDAEEAIVAGGCFWGVEHLLHQVPGVLRVESGYTGGHVNSPTYEQVCQGNTGHYEAVRILFDSKKLDYLHLLKCFFEIHDPTQQAGQGPDLGSQYQSAVFYHDDKQHQKAEEIIKLLSKRGYKVATKLFPASIFWPAESYHQRYYSKNSKTPYCHQRVNRFED